MLDNLGENLLTNEKVMPDLDVAEMFRNIDVSPEELHWDTLISQIIEGNVIPVIGPDILLDNSNINQILISGLAKKYGVTSNPTSFSQLLYDKNFPQFRRRAIYSELNQFFMTYGDAFAPSSLLKRILSIKYFPFVITTSFSPIVEKAMAEIWKERKVNVYVFSNNPSTTAIEGTGDIASSSSLKDPGVYYMFGKVTAQAKRFVVTDYDMLDFTRSWLSETRRPKNLSAALKDKYLLVIGANYSDWLFRFIWYSMKNHPESKVQGMVVNEYAENSLVDFLSRIDTFTLKDPEFVVSEIERRLDKKKEDIKKIRLRPQNYTDVFISYSRQDPDITEKLYSALTQRGLNVWYDKSNLEPADDFKKEIQRSIETTKLFVPVLTDSIIQEVNDYHTYRTEWSQAGDRAKGMGRKFIYPFCSTNFDFESAELIPEIARRNAFFFDNDESISVFAEKILNQINSL